MSGLLQHLSDSRISFSRLAEISAAKKDLEIIVYIRGTAKEKKLGKLLGRISKFD
jgi:hypothetical protein